MNLKKAITMSIQTEASLAIPAALSIMYTYMTSRARDGVWWRYISRSTGSNSRMVMSTQDKTMMRKLKVLGLDWKRRTMRDRVLPKTQNKIV